MLPGDEWISWPFCWKRGFPLSLNRQAIELLEENRYEEALALFQEALHESRDAQSLTNLAWIYCHEEDEFEKALALVEEAIAMNPASHFPYYLQGELYCRLEKWEEAQAALEQALIVHPSQTAFHNLAVAHFQLGNIEDAARFFKHAAGQSDDALYCYAKCLVDLGKWDAAKRILASFSESEDDFVGEVEVADLYVEIGCYDAAVQWFAKGWDGYWKQPNWVGRYVFALREIDQPEKAQAILNEAIRLKQEEWQDSVAEECDDDWTERDKEEYLNNLLQDMKAYEQISSGTVPSFEFNTSFRTACYLFGCARHQHPEYQG